MRRMLSAAAGLGLLSATEAARECGLSLNQWQHYMRVGLFPRPSVPVGDSKRFYYRPEEVERIKLTVARMRGGK